MTPVTKVVNPLTHTPHAALTQQLFTQRPDPPYRRPRRSVAPIRGSAPAVWTSHPQRAAAGAGSTKPQIGIHIRPNRQTPPSLGMPPRTGHGHHPQRKPAARTEGTKTGPPSKPLQQPRRYHLATYKNRRLESNTTNTTRSPRRRSASQPAQPNQPQTRRFVIW